jgi:hypothetical protein
MKIFKLYWLVSQSPNTESARKDSANSTLLG